MNSTSTVAPRAHPAALHWRLYASIYDAFPVLALWLLTSAVVLMFNGNRPFAPFSLGQCLLWIACWAVTGAYFVLSWQRGGQTLGMRPWRLRVCDAHGGRPTPGSLVVRYVVATFSLAFGGLGFLWSLFERERRTWHDLASGSVMVRMERSAR